MESRTLTKKAAGAAVATSLVAMSGGAAMARSSDNADRPIRQVRQVVDERTAARASMVAAGLTGERPEANDRISLPRRGNERIEVRSEMGAQTLEVGLPGGLRAGATSHRQDEMASFEARNQSFAVTTESLETGARALITIGGPSAPTEYHFDIDSSDTIRLVPVPSGGVEVIDSNGEAIAYVKEPWAVDAAGEAVATNFRVEGSTLIQVVEHAGATYPVVADPALQHDCGWVTCTMRFDRQRTHFIGHSGSSLAAITSAVCALGTGPLAVVCIAAINAIGWAVSSNARNYYNNGNCYGIRYPRNFPHAPIPPPHSTQVNHGTYNCTGK